MINNTHPLLYQPQPLPVGPAAKSHAKAVLYLISDKINWGSTQF